MNRKKIDNIENHISERPESGWSLLQESGGYVAALPPSVRKGYAFP